MRRRDQRRAAVFALYQHDVTGRPVGELLGAGAALFSTALTEAVGAHREELDAVIERNATGWHVERVAPLERAILRVALLELLHPEQLPGDSPIPAEGAIDEAVETAKTFCGADAPGFVNGILGAAYREVRENPSAR